MKKRIRVFLLAIVGLWIALDDDEAQIKQKKQVPPQVKAATVTAGPTPLPAPVPSPQRAPARMARSQMKRPDLRSSFVPDKNFDLGKSFILARDIGAVPKKDYLLRMGELVSEDQTWSYFRKSSNESAVSVAYQPSRNRFLPISSVIKVRNTTPEERQELKAQGHSEYHYLSNLNLLFIESTPEDVLKTYEELKQKGLTVELEVLSERVKAH